MSNLVKVRLKGHDCLSKQIEDCIFDMEAKGYSYIETMHFRQEYDYSGYREAIVCFSLKGKKLQVKDRETKA